MIFRPILIPTIAQLSSVYKGKSYLPFSLSYRLVEEDRERNRGGFRGGIVEGVKGGTEEGVEGEIGRDPGEIERRGEGVEGVEGGRYEDDSMRAWNCAFC